MTVENGSTLIALCGFPKAGKSTVQDYLRDEYGIIPVDDGAPLRDAACFWFGLSQWQVTSQEGKAEKIEICEKEWVVRDVLGTIGNRLEETFGDQIMPELVLNGQVFQRNRAYSFGSVRKNQGLTYKRHGGFVIEVKREGCEAFYDFDKYDESLVDFTINNDHSLDDLYAEVDRVMKQILNRE